MTGKIVFKNVIKTAFVINLTTQVGASFVLIHDIRFEKNNILLWKQSWRFLSHHVGYGNIFISSYYIFVFYF
jgi:hypothetical protein